MVFFGRFQPLHKGHMAALEWLLERYQEVVILVGMADESHTWVNPFTAGERLLMLKEAIKARGYWDRVVTATIQTLHVFSGNAGFVMSYVPPADAVATANHPVRRAFRDAGFNTVTPPLINRSEWCGEYIRLLMLHGDDRWRSLVPREVAEIIDALDGVSRLQEIARGYTPLMDLESAAEACMNAPQHR